MRLPATAFEEQRCEKAVRVLGLCDDRRIVQENKYRDHALELYCMGGWIYIAALIGAYAFQHFYFISLRKAI